MADYELHADYNRNGRLDASAAEYALRSVAPGAIVVPNLDADARRLPSSVALGSRVTLDRDQPVVLANDDEALPLRIVVNNASAPAGSRFFLRPEGFARIRVRINDAAGRTWTISMTLGAAMHVEAKLDVDLLQIESGDPPLLTLLGTDEMLLGEVLCALLESQFEAHRVTAEDVRNAFDGRTLLAAQHPLGAQCAGGDHDGLPVPARAGPRLPTARAPWSPTRGC